MIYDNGRLGRMVMGLARAEWLVCESVCICVYGCVCSTDPQLGQDCKWVGVD